MGEGGILPSEQRRDNRAVVDCRGMGVELKGGRGGGREHIALRTKKRENINAESL